MPKWEIKDVDLWERDAILVTEDGEFYFQFGMKVAFPSLGDALQCLFMEDKIIITK